MSYRKTMKRTFLASTAILLPLSVAGPVLAQDFDEAEVEEITITGSRIARNEFSSASAISTFDTKDVTNAGVTGIDEFLKDIPAFTGYQLGTTTNNGGDGTKKVDMRGLGFNRTLVLINGRRQVGDTLTDGAVDLNTIPMGMVKRIEVLKDGASTIYGSDALAGVVNVILHDNYEGFEMSADFGAATANWDAENYGVSMLAGASSDKGNVTFSAEYNRQKPIFQADRDFAAITRYSTLIDGAFVGVPSGSSNSRKIRTSLFDAGATALLGAAGASANQIWDDSLNSVRDMDFGDATSGGDLFDYGAANLIMTPNERWQIATNGHYDIMQDSFMGDVSAYFEGMYTKRTSRQVLAPDASFAVNPNFNGHWNDMVPSSNPYNPFGDNASGVDGILGTADDLNPYGIEGQDVRINRRFVESGGRDFYQSANTVRIVAGFNGDISENVSWDASYTFADYEVLQNTTNYGRFDRWETAVDPALCAADATCAANGVLNPFGEFGSITDDQMAYLSAGSLKNWSTARMTMWQFGLTGDTAGSMDLAGGPIGWALGFEQRRESGIIVPDEFAAGGLTTSGASDPLDGNFKVTEFYAEVAVPVLENLNLSGSARHSSYNTSAGKKTTFKVGFDYAPIDGLLLRGGYSTGFRAPNITELNQQNLSTFPVVDSVCEFYDTREDITDTIRTNCAALGLPAGPAGEVGFAWQSLYTNLAPLAPLTPENSKTLALGIVFEPETVPGLSMSADYWDITINNYIGVPNFNDLFRGCMDSVDFSSIACDAFVGQGYSSDLPYDIADNFIYPTDATAAFGNLGKLSTNGMDFNIAYDTDLEMGAVTGLSIRVGATWQMNRIEEWSTFEISRETVGTADGGAIFPEWRANTSVGVNGENWTFAWETRYIGATDDKYRPASITTDAEAEAVLYNDFVGSYTYENTTLTVGLNNAFNKKPPYFHSVFNANTEPGTYDIIGRRLFANVRLKF